MVVDCHVHLPGCDLATSLRLADQLGIDRMCMFALGNEFDPLQPAPPPARHWASIGAPHQTDAWNPPPERITASNRLVEELMEEAGGRLDGLCFVNPRHPEHALEEIRTRVGSGPMQGIKLWISCRSSDPMVEPIAALAVELDVPILQHCWNKFGGNLACESTTQDVADLAAKFPTLKLIAPHLSGHGEEGVLELAPHPNVFLDTSGMLPDAGILEFAVATVGVERILFGSDAPLRHPGSALARIQASRLSPRERQAVLSGNYQRLFKK